MTPELFERLEKSQKPFDSEVVFSSVESSMETLLTVMQYFRNIVLKPDESLFKYYDWFEHDGFQTHSKAISYSECISMINSKESLLKSIEGSYDVRTAVYPQNYSWLMRWCIDLEDLAYCDFEFCASSVESKKALELIHQIDFEGLGRLQTKEFFKNRAG